MTEDELQTMLKNNPAIKIQGKNKEQYAAANKFIESQIKPKYRNKKTKVDGIYFDSTKESEYYLVLKVWLKAKEILGFALQPKFLLQDGNEEMEPIYYIADFLVIQSNGTSEIWDVKASEDYTTDVYKLKKKMFMARYPGLKIIEKY